MTATKIYVDSWDPAYGTGLDPAEAGPTGHSSAALKLDVEVPTGAWRALTPPGDIRAPSTVLLVDGVRRIDARIWVEEPDASLQPGIAASYAAGVVRCDLSAGRAEVVAAKIERGLFTPSVQVQDLITAGARYSVRHTAAADPAQLSAAVQPQLHELEALVSGQARVGQTRADQTRDGQARDSQTPADQDDDLLVIDGPLRGRTQLPRALGYVKTHRVQYLPAEQASLIGALRAGQRCPVFLLGTSWHRYTWYVKLPGPAGSPWAGVVRVEASADLPRGQVIALADLSAVTLPRFASTSYKDARAPQNLTPIAGLERKLRGMLGDARLLMRALVTAASAQREAVAPAGTAA